MTFRDDRQALLDRLRELEPAAAENIKLRQRIAELESDNRRLRAQLRPSYSPPGGPVPESAPPPPRSHAPVVPSGKPILTLHITGKVPGDRHARSESFDADVIKVGRVPSCHLHLDNAEVARVHAVIERSETNDRGAFVIIDLGSEAGTYVNGNRVNKTSLAINDTVRIGPFTMTVAY